MVGDASGGGGGGVGGGGGGVGVDLRVGFGVDAVVLAVPALSVRDGGACFRLLLLLLFSFFLLFIFRRCRCLIAFRLLT